MQLRPPSTSYTPRPRSWPYEYPLFHPRPPHAAPSPPHARSVPLAVAVGGARQRVSSDSSGLTFRPDKRLSVGYFVVMAMLIPAAPLFAVLLSRGELDLSTTRGIQIAVSVAFWALALLAVVLPRRREGVAVAHTDESFGRKARRGP